MNALDNTRSDCANSSSGSGKEGVRCRKVLAEWHVHQCRRRLEERAILDVLHHANDVPPATLESQAPTDGTRRRPVFRRKSFADNSDWSGGVRIRGREVTP